MADSVPPTWRLAIEALHDGVALVDRRGVLVSCNASFRELSRLVADSASAGGVSPLLRKELPWLEPALSRPDESFEVQVGSRWLDARCVALGDAGSVIVLTDVTTRRRTAEQLRASNEVLGALFESSPVAILALDPQQRVTLWNRAAERMFGWTAEEITGRPYHLVVPEGDRTSFQGLFDRVIGGEGFTDVEVTRLRRDGTTIHVGVATAPLRDASGAVVGAMATLTDLTERNRFEEQVRQVQRMEAIGRLAGGVAHDFNNLLTVILSACELLEGPARPDSARLLADVRRGAERAADLTRQLLAFSRRQVLQPARIDLSDAVREAAAMLERVIGEDIAVELRVGEPLHVLADRGQLQRVVLNLAVNARDAMPTGGRLLLATRRVRPEARPKTLAEGPYVELVVSDTGAGVDPDVLPHIFEPFFTTKGPGEGTGLGLAMVYGVVQQTGGEVLVVSEPGRGTTFRVVLPEAAPDVSQPTVTPELRDRRDVDDVWVLLVEDDDEVRSTLRELLLALGYRVLVAGGGEEALAVNERHAGPLQVLLTDVVMAGMSGREVAEAMVAQRPDIRVLFMSGYTDDAVLRRGVHTAGTSFLQKPFTSAALDRQIRRLLHR